MASETAGAGEPAATTPVRAVTRDPARCGRTEPTADIYDQGASAYEALWSPTGPS